VALFENSEIRSVADTTNASSGGFIGHLLTASEVAAGFSNRAQIFAAFGGGAGWNPQP
jgi:hypothetical protein